MELRPAAGFTKGESLRRVGFAATSLHGGVNAVAVRRVRFPGVTTTVSGTAGGGLGWSALRVAADGDGDHVHRNDCLEVRVVVGDSSPCQLAATVVMVVAEFQQQLQTLGASMIRRYSGNKKSIEARSADNGRTWSVKFFDTGRLTEYSGGTLAEVDALAAKNGLTLDR